MLGHTNRDSAESMGGIFQITTRYGFRLAIWYDMVQPGILGIFRYLFLFISPQVDGRTSRDKQGSLNTLNHGMGCEIWRQP